jgi:hypothetical protein
LRAVGASQQVRAAEAARDQALTRAAAAEQAVRSAQQETARPQAGEQAARAERAERQADAYRGELARSRSLAENWRAFGEVIWQEYLQVHRAAVGATLGALDGHGSSQRL